MCHEIGERLQLFSAFYYFLFTEPTNFGVRVFCTDKVPFFRSNGERVSGKFPPREERKGCQEAKTLFRGTSGRHAEAELGMPGAN